MGSTDAGRDAQRYLLRQFVGPMPILMMTGEGRSMNWLDFRRFALVLALLVIASYPAVIFGLETFVFRDFGFFGYPLAHHHRQSIWQGELPLWNPHSNLGIPFLAQWNTLVLYPPSIFYLLFPLQWSLAVFCLIHLYLGGLGMYLLANRWTWSNLAASVAGLTFAFNGLSLNCLMWPNNMAALGLMPWVVLWAERGWREGGRAWFSAALVAGCQMLAGAPEIILFTWLFLTALVIGQVFHLRDPKCFFRFCALVLLVACLAAAQLLPLGELLILSHRTENYGRGDWSMPSWGWANLIHPLFYCFRSSPGVYFQGSQFWTSSYYPGIIVVALSLMAWQVRKKRVYLLQVILFSALLMALGSNGGLYWVVETLFPQIRFARFPIKFVTVAIFVFPILAAYGVRFICQPVAERERIATGESLEAAPLFGWKRFWPFALVFLILAILTLITYLDPQPTDDSAPLWTNPLMRALYLTVAVILLWLLHQVSLARSRIILQLSLLVVLWLDAWTHAPNQNPTVKPDVYSSDFRQKGIDPKPTHGTARAMLSREAQVRLSLTFMADQHPFYLINRQALYANCNLLDAIPKLNGFYSLYVQFSDEVVDAIYSSTNRHPPEILDFLGVTYLTAPEKIFEWVPRTNVMPLATVGQSPRLMEGKAALKFLVSEEFDPRRTVLLPSNTVTDAKGDPQARIIQARYAANRIDLQAEATRPTLLVVAQSWYPGWMARVNGKTTPILRANHGFQALEIPAGRHRVELIYRDRKFLVGVVVSLIAFVFCLGGLWKSRWHHQLQQPELNRRKQS